MKKNLLVIDDDTDICKLLRLYLNKAGYNVHICHNGKEALSLLSSTKVDLILLDIMLPDIEGIALCERIRKEFFCPLIFISCIDEDSSILKAFKKGGDDYLIKPFNYDELIARIEANLRRVNIERYLNFKKNEVISFAEYKIDINNHTLSKDNNLIHLSPIEFDILTYLINNPNKVLSYGDIYKAIWKDDSLNDNRTVMVHVCNLRKKIEDNQAKPRYIKTVRKYGYIFQI